VVKVVCSCESTCIGLKGEECAKLYGFWEEPPTSGLTASDAPSSDFTWIWAFRASWACLTETFFRSLDKLITCFIAFICFAFTFLVTKLSSSYSSGSGWSTNFLCWGFFWCCLDFLLVWAGEAFSYPPLLVVVRSTSNGSSSATSLWTSEAAGLEVSCFFAIFWGSVWVSFDEICLFLGAFQGWLGWSGHIPWYCYTSFLIMLRNEVR